MKKILCIAVLACVIMGSAFAQQKAAASPTAGAKSSAALDIIPLFGSFTGFSEKNKTFRLGIEASYERLIAPHWSAGVNLIVGFKSTPVDYDIWGDVRDETGIFKLNFGLDAEGRYYPFADFDMLFLGATLGFRVSTGFLAYTLAGYTYPGEFGLNVGIKAGYKLVTSKRFYLEPALSFSTYDNLQGHLRLGMVF